MPGGGPMRSILTLGFDSRRKQFVGAFVADCMAMLWTYTGALDASGQQLTLEAEGPDATGEGQTKYRDIIQIIDADHRVTRSEMLMPDGQWVEYMKLEYTRQRS